MGGDFRQGECRSVEYYVNVRSFNWKFKGFDAVFAVQGGASVGS